MRLALCIALQLASFALLAQGGGMRNHQISFTLGAVATHMQRLPADGHLNFLNYFNTHPEFFDEAVVKLGYRFDFLSNMSADLRLLVMSDLAPDNFDMTAFYHFGRHFAVGIGSSLYKSYITHFEQFQAQIMPEYYMVDGNVRQFKVYDLGFYITPAFNIVNTGWFLATARCDIGVSSFLREEAVFHHKRSASNERVIHHYLTRIAFQPYINPRIEMRLRAFSINSTSGGFLLHSNLLYGRRGMDYNRTVQRWTSDGAVAEVVRAPKHSYARFEADFGLYVRW